MEFEVDELKNIFESTLKNSKIKSVRHIQGTDFAYCEVNEVFFDELKELDEILIVDSIDGFHSDNIFIYVRNLKMKNEPTTSTEMKLENISIGTRLRAIDECRVFGGESSITVGIEYEVVDILREQNQFIIYDDEFTIHHYNIENASNFFEIVEKNDI